MLVETSQTVTRFDAQPRKDAMNLIATVLYDWPVAVARRLDWLAPLLARITVGVVFAVTGWGKLNNLEKITAFFGELGIPYPQFQAPFASATEFVCGTLLVVGMATRVASIPLIIVMLVAIATAQWENIDSLSALLGTVEWAYVAIFAWLALAGPGPISLDYLLGRAANREEI